MVQRVLKSDHYMPIVLGLLVTLGGGSFKFYLDLRDTAKAYHEVKASLESLQRQITVTDRRTQRILGILEGQSSYSRYNYLSDAEGDLRERARELDK